MMYLIDMENLFMWILGTRDGTAGTCLPEFICGVG